MNLRFYQVENFLSLNYYLAIVFFLSREGVGRTAELVWHNLFSKIQLKVSNSHRPPKPGKSVVGSARDARSR